MVNKTEQIIPNGYKQTELGVIPEDWGIFKLSDQFLIYAGGDAPRDSLSEYKTNNCIYPIYANAIKQKGLYGYTKHKRAKPDSITITARGFLGHTEYRNHSFYPIVRLLVLEPIKSIDAKYSAYVLNGCVKFAIESTGVPQLTVPQVGKYMIAAPNKITEQKAIAAALSDIDNLVTSLEKLIEKKRQIKKGTMQELLTGKRRLSGFSEEWTKAPISQISTIFKGRGLSKDKLNSQGAHSCVLYGELFTTYNEVISEVISRTNYNEGVLSRVGDVLMPGSTTTVGRDLAEASALLLDNIQLGGDINIIRPFLSNMAPEFLAYLLSNSYISDIERAAKGVTVYHLHGSDIGKIEIKYPDKSEQIKIVKFLSDMDSEIRNLNKKLKKYRLIKKGVMQQLLTGKIRLI